VAPVNEARRVPREIPTPPNLAAMLRALPGLPGDVHEREQGRAPDGGGESQGAPRLRPARDA
jgi:hypothetical protein